MRLLTRVARLVITEDNPSMPGASIGGGNTISGTYEQVLDTLGEAMGRDFSLLDVPCGTGVFLDEVKHRFPDARTTGWDLDPPGTPFPHELRQVDLSRAASLDTSAQFDVITCISGVMEFDNTLSFFELLGRSIQSDGLLIVTNDNLLSVRDRLLYLIGGRFGQYKFTLARDAPTWKVVTLQNLLRVIHDAGFEAYHLCYVRPKPLEWLWSPLAALIYLLQRTTAGVMDPESGLTLLPFRSLISRHYVLYCRRRLSAPKPPPAVG